MDISSVSVAAVAANTSVTDNALASQMQVGVLKKVMDNEKAMAAQLVETINQSSSALPPNVGNNINVTA